MRSELSQEITTFSQSLRLWCDASRSIPSGARLTSVPGALTWCLDLYHQRLLTVPRRPDMAIINIAFLPQMICCLWRMSVSAARHVRTDGRRRTAPQPAIANDNANDTAVEWVRNMKRANEGGALAAATEATSAHTPRGGYYPCIRIYPPHACKVVCQAGCRIRLRSGRNMASNVKGVLTAPASRYIPKL